MHASHRIRRLTFRCRAASESEALAMRKRLVEGWDQMLPSIERELDEWAGDAEFIRIPRLELKLKAYDEVVLIRKLRAALEEIVPQNPLARRAIRNDGACSTTPQGLEADRTREGTLPSVRPVGSESDAGMGSGGSKDIRDAAGASGVARALSSPATGFEARDATEFTSQILEHYLLTGRIPWYAATHADLGTTLRERLRTDDHEIPRYLIEHSTIDAWVRWMQLLPGKEIVPRMTELIPVLAAASENWKSLLEALLHDEIESESSIQKLLWIALVLNAAVNPAGPMELDMRDHPGPYALTDRQREQLRHALLKRNVPARWIEENLERFGRAFRTVSLDPESTARRVDAAAPASPSSGGISPEEESSGKRQVPLRPAFEAQDSPIAPRANEADAAGISEIAFTEQRSGPDFREARWTPRKSSVEASSPETESGETREREVPDSEWNRAPEGIADDSSAEQRAPRSERVFLAGCVLLHPYLRRLFDASGIYYDERHIRPTDLQRAAALLYFSATGFLNPLDFELDIVRLLLGLPRDGMLIVSPELLDDADRAEVERMLSALIGHWSRLKNTSIDGLRGAFLQRQAFLSLREDRAYLYFERLGHDVLLDFLPYSISTIKLPWMPKPLYVEW